MRIKSEAERRLEANIGEVIRGMDIFWNDDAGDADLLAEAVGRLKRTYRRDLRLVATDTREEPGR